MSCSVYAHQCFTQAKVYCLRQVPYKTQNYCTIHKTVKIIGGSQVLRLGLLWIERRLANIRSQHQLPTAPFLSARRGALDDGRPIRLGARIADGYSRVPIASPIGRRPRRPSGYIPLGILRSLLSFLYCTYLHLSRVILPPLLAAFSGSPLGEVG